MDLRMKRNMALYKERLLSHISIISREIEVEEAADFLLAQEFVKNSLEHYGYSQPWLFTPGTQTFRATGITAARLFVKVQYFEATDSIRTQPCQIYEGKLRSSDNKTTYRQFSSNEKAKVKRCTAALDTAYVGHFTANGDCYKTMAKIGAKMEGSLVDLSRWTVMFGADYVRACEQIKGVKFNDRVRAIAPSLPRTPRKGVREGILEVLVCGFVSKHQIRCNTTKDENGAYATKLNADTGEGFLHFLDLPLASLQLKVWEGCNPFAHRGGQHAQRMAAILEGDKTIVAVPSDIIDDDFAEAAPAETPKENNKSVDLEAAFPKTAPPSKETEEKQVSPFAELVGEELYNLYLAADHIKAAEAYCAWLLTKDEGCIHAADLYVSGEKPTSLFSLSVGKTIRQKANDQEAQLLVRKNLSTIGSLEGAILEAQFSGDDFEEEEEDFDEEEEDFDEESISTRKPTGLLDLDAWSTPKGVDTPAEVKKEPFPFDTEANGRSSLSADLNKLSEDETPKASTRGLPIDDFLK